MFGGFQVGPFQPLPAFQQEGGSVYPPPAGHKPKKPRPPRRRRYQVEIDGQIFEVDSAAEALQVLEKAKALAEQAATAVAEQVLRRKVRSQRRPTVTLRPPEITTDAPVPREALEEIKSDIQATYQRIGLDTEIKYHFAKLLREQAEEEETILLMLH